MPLSNDMKDVGTKGGLETPDKDTTTPNDDLMDLSDLTDEELNEKVTTDMGGDEPPTDEEDEEDDNDEKKSSSKKEDNEDEIDEDEEPENLNLISPARKRDILKKYPELFKDFPYLEVANYRDKAFSEIFPTIDDAKEANDRSQSLEKFESELSSGNLDGILTAVKTTDANAFNELVDNYLPALEKVDEKAYYTIIGNIVTRTVQNMFSRGKELGNEELQRAAVILNQFAFNTDKPVPIRKFSSKANNNGEKDPEREKFENEKVQFAQEKFSAAQMEVGSSITSRLKSTLDNNIDPKGSMTDYVKRNAIRDTLDALDVAIQGDTRFRSALDKLWIAASKQNYSPSAMREIRQAYLSKAQSLLPPLISKFRAEALKGMNRGNKEDKDRKGPVTKGQSTPNQNRGSNRTESSRSENKSTKKMSTLDILNSD